MDSNPNNLRPIQVLSRFLHAFTHELRTPLSVINNEMFCLLAGESQQGARSAQQACQSIAARLREVSAALPDDVSLSPMPVAALCSHLKREHPALEITGDIAEAEIYVHVPSLLGALKKMLPMLGLAPNDVKGLVSMTADHLLIVFGDSAVDSSLCQALAQFCEGRAYNQVMLASIVDAVLWAHGAKLSLAPGTARLEFPLRLS